MTSTAAPTHELYAWDEGNRAWLAIDQGDETAMTKEEQAHYRSARRFGLSGAAYWVAEIDDVPGLAPAQLGAEIV